MITEFLSMKLHWNSIIMAKWLNRQASPIHTRWAILLIQSTKSRKSELQSKEIEVIHAGRYFEGDVTMDSQGSEDNNIAIITMNHNAEGNKHMIVENVDFYTENQEAVDAYFVMHG